MIVKYSTDFLMNSIMNSSITDDGKSPWFMFWVGKLKMKLHKQICQVPCTILPYK